MSAARIVQAAIQRLGGSASLRAITHAAGWGADHERTSHALARARLAGLARCQGRRIWIAVDAPERNEVDRAKAALYVSASERRDNCAGCVRSEPVGRVMRCGWHRIEVSKGAICAEWKARQ